MTYKTIKLQDHAVHLLENLNRQREDNLFCDVILKVKGKQFPAHRNVLSACSEYFRTMFSSKMQEQYAKDVSLEGVTATAVEQVLEYIYTEDIKLSLENVFDVLQAASLMLLTDSLTLVSDLLDVIGNFLSESMSPLTCLRLRDVSKFFNLESLQKKAEECIFENFEEVASQQKFCDLQKEDFAPLLSSDDIKVWSENIVFEALVRWVNSNEKQRKSQFPLLFKHVRLQHVSQNFLASKVRNEPLVKQFHECRDLVEDAFHFHIDPSLFEAQKSRICSVIFSLEIQGDVERLDFTPNDVVIQKVPTRDFQIEYTDVIARSNRIVYFCGNSGNNSSSVISFDGRNFKLEGNMNSSNVSEATAFCVADHLYVIGSDSKSTVDVYQLRPTFKFIKTLDENTFLPLNASSVVVRGLAYIIGGNSRDQNFQLPLNYYDDSDDYGDYDDYAEEYDDEHYVSNEQQKFEAQSTVTSFNPTTEKWTNKASMNSVRYHCGVAVLGSKIFVCGGYAGTGGQYVNSMEYMDVAQNVWTMIGSHCPSNLGATSICVVGQELYVIGQSCDVLWKFDTESEKWKQDQRYGNRSGSFRILSLN